MTRNEGFVVSVGLSTLADCGSRGVDPKIHHLPKSSLPMCEHTEGVLRDFVLVFRRDILP